MVITLESGIMGMICMWTEQSEDTEQTIEHGRPSIQKGMQHC